MAGGIGSRFWPLSRSCYPKQFLDVLGVGQTLLQLTFERFLTYIPLENILVATGECYKNLVKAQLPTLTDACILTEPIMRNTAPCIAYAAHKIEAKNPKASLVIAPSDHVIAGSNANHHFAQIITAALEKASQGDWLLTLGIIPSRPDTGYGYIHYAHQESANELFCKVKKFTEKPNQEQAESFIQSGDYLWNAGIFVWSVSSILHAFECYLPAMHGIFQKQKPYYNTEEETLSINECYASCENISIDYGILEKADNVLVRPIHQTDFSWSDLGTWSSLYAIKQSEQKEPTNNVVMGTNQSLLDDSKGCMVHVPIGKLVVLQGLSDYIVVDTPDALLICQKSKEQEIKQIVADIQTKKDSFA